MRQWKGGRWHRKKLVFVDIKRLVLFGKLKDG